MMTIATLCSKLWAKLRRRRPPGPDFEARIAAALGVAIDPAAARWYAAQMAAGAVSSALLHGLIFSMTAASSTITYRRSCAFTPEGASTAAATIFRSTSRGTVSSVKLRTLRRAFTSIWYRATVRSISLACSMRWMARDMTDG